MKAIVAEDAVFRTRARSCSPLGLVCLFALAAATASPVLAEPIYKHAPSHQNCVPQYDSSGAQKAPYC